MSISGSAIRQKNRHLTVAAPHGIPLTIHMLLKGRPMRAALAACVLVAACVLAGCRSQQEQAISNAEREQLYGAPRTISWDPLHSSQDRYYGIPSR